MSRIVNFFNNIILAYESIVSFTRDRDLEMNSDHMFQAVLCLFASLFLMGISGVLGTFGYFFMPGLFITFAVVFGIFSVVLLIFMVIKLVEAFDWN